MTEDILQEIQEMPVKMAFILDGKVIDVLHTDERLAAIFLSQPTVVDVTVLDENATAEIGHSYNQATGKFTKPKPFESWILNEESGVWVAPLQRPDDSNFYLWNEETTSWSLQS
jgi:hypothetical protein